MVYDRKEPTNLKFPDQSGSISLATFTQGTLRNKKPTTNIPENKHPYMKQTQNSGNKILSW